MLFLYVFLKDQKKKKILDGIDPSSFITGLRPFIKIMMSDCVSSSVFYANSHIKEQSQQLFLYTVTHL